MLYFDFIVSEFSGSNRLTLTGKKSDSDLSGIHRRMSMMVFCQMFI